MLDSKLNYKNNNNKIKLSILLLNVFFLYIILLGKEIWEKQTNVCLIMRVKPTLL